MSALQKNTYVVVRSGAVFFEECKREGWMEEHIWKKNQKMEETT